MYEDQYGFGEQLVVVGRGYLVVIIHLIEDVSIDNEYEF